MTSKLPHAKAVRLVAVLSFSSLPCSFQATFSTSLHATKQESPLLERWVVHVRDTIKNRVARISDTVMCCALQRLHVFITMMSAPS